MFLAVAAFAQLLRECAPNIGARTMTALVRVESAGNPYAIHDNTASRSFSPVDAREAAAWARQLLSQRHNIDLGLSQINSANLAKLGMSVDEAFDPCANLHGGATILSFDYRASVAKFGEGQFALRRAIGAYNTGSLYEGDAYVSQILAAAGVSAQQDFLVPDLRALPASRSFLFRTRPRVVRRPAKSPSPSPTGALARESVTPFNAPLLVTSGIGPAVPTAAAAPASPARAPIVVQRAVATDAAASSPSQSNILIPVSAPAIPVQTTATKP